MSCVRPLRAYRNEAGSVVIGSVVPNVAGHDGAPMELPCGKCIGCRQDRARMWAIRIGYEAQFYDSNWFVTLTYDDEHLPKNLSLKYSDFQGFMKRLRAKKRGYEPGPNGKYAIRFFCAGEYGGITKRAHFHAILFNVKFSDCERLVNGTYRSLECEKLWGLGNVVLGTVTIASAAYVAGYTLKKVYGRDALSHYEDVVDVNTGELSSRIPEFCKMSLKPGIGGEWFDKYVGDLFPGDFAYADGKKWKVPRYFWEKFKKYDPVQAEEVAYLREIKARELREESTPERRAVREEFLQRKTDFYNSHE